MYNFLITHEAGGQYHRAFEVTLSNKKGQPRTVSYMIEQLTNTNNDGFVTNFIAAETISEPTTDAEKAEVIPLIDDNGNQHGTMSRGQIANMMLLLLNSEMVHNERKKAAANMMDGANNEPL